MKKIVTLLLVSILTLAATAQTFYFTQGERKGSDTPYGNNITVGQYIATDDISMWCETYDEGDPLVVLHGGGVGCAYEMGALIDSLRAQKKYRVIILATRGHGRTGLGHKHMSLEQRARDFAPVIRQLAGGRMVRILGFSDGAYSAMSVAINYPQLVERVVAIGAGTLNAGAMPREVNVKDWEALDKRFCDQQKALMLEPDRWQEFASDYMRYWHNVNLGKDFFSKIPCPVLFMAGDRDDHAPVQTVVDAHQLTPRSHLSIIPDAWHTCWLDNMPATWSAIKGFINDK